MIELFNKANAAGGLNDPGVQQQFRAAIASAAAQKQDLIFWQKISYQGIWNDS